MAKPNWGKKLKCQGCGAGFYDLNEPKPTCPKCETEYAPVVKSRRGSAAPVAPVVKKVVPAKPKDDADEADLLLEGDDELDEVLDDDDEDDDSLIEDTSDLDDDDDDMAEIKEHAEVGIEDKD